MVVGVCLCACMRVFAHECACIRMWADGHVSEPVLQPAGVCLGGWGVCLGRA